ncbi:MAG: hypothetical protein FWG83_06910 [Oscillospiraceae bacterium]|nr:hypothetical protein [Oscillospiraceae bacterium]
MISRLLKYAYDWQVVRARIQSDKVVSAFLPEGEVLRWSGRPGFVATFNRYEFFAGVAVTAIITFISVVLLWHPPSTSTPFSSYIEVSLPPEIIAVMVAFFMSMMLLFIGWVRQIYRYMRTLTVYYAVTDLRLLIFKKKKIIAELPIESVRSVAISLKSKFYGNGTLVFNQGEDFFENRNKNANVIESPPNHREVFAFFNVLQAERVFLKK